MRRYLLQRLLALAAVIWAAVTLSFVALRIIPGDPIEAQLIAGGAPPQAIAERRRALGLDRPPGEQYCAYWAGLLRGDLGLSYLSQRPPAKSRTAIPPGR